MFLFTLGCRSGVNNLTRNLCRGQKFQRSRNLCVRCDRLIGLLVPRLFEIIARLICRGDGRNSVSRGAHVDSGFRCNALGGPVSIFGRHFPALPAFALPTFASDRLNHSGGLFRSDNFSNRIFKGRSRGRNGRDFLGRDVRRQTNGNRSLKS